MIKLDRNALAVAKATDTIGGRPAIECCLIGNGKIVGADGFILVIRPVEGDSFDRNMMVPAKYLKKAKILKGHTHINVSRNNDLEVIIDDGDCKMLVREFMGTYPEYEKFIPTEKPVYTIRLGVGLLKKLLSSVGDASSISFEFMEKGNSSYGGARSAVKFIAGESYGVLMPMSDDTKEGW